MYAVQCRSKIEFVLTFSRFALFYLFESSINRKSRIEESRRKKKCFAPEEAEEEDEEEEEEEGVEKEEDHQ